MFAEDEEYEEFSRFLEEWKTTSQSMKESFLSLQELVVQKSGVLLTFKARPGISYSLRAGVRQGTTGDEGLFVLVDVIDDDPENRWLSVCFYGDMITDPMEKGDLIPGGLLGEDGYCFDLYEGDKEDVDYVKARIEEAYSRAIQV